MSFHRIAVTDAERNRELRTNENFRSRLQPEHHLQQSCLEDLPIDMIKQFPVSDSLHLIDLGIMKRLLFRWMGKLKSIPRLWSDNVIDEISGVMLRFNQTMPVEIHRKIRSLRHIHFFKATEFRTIMLYVGIVVLKDFLPKNEYDLFLKLFCAVSICTSKKYVTYLPLARTLFIEYIEGHISTYGIESITSNIHNLNHVVDDVLLFGELNAFNAYEFENCLHSIKLLLKQCDKPLEQLSRRIYEISATNRQICENSQVLSFPKALEPFTCVNGSRAYRKFIIKPNVIISNNVKNQWIMLDDENQTIVRFEYGFKRDNEYMFCGHRLSSVSKENFFTRPFNSQYLNIFSYEDKCD